MPEEASQGLCRPWSFPQPDKTCVAARGGLWSGQGPLLGYSLEIRTALAFITDQIPESGFHRRLGVKTARMETLYRGWGRRVSRSPSAWERPTRAPGEKFVREAFYYAPTQSVPEVFIPNGHVPCRSEKSRPLLKCPLWLVPRHSACQNVRASRIRLIVSALAGTYAPGTVGYVGCREGQGLSRGHLDQGTSGSRQATAKSIIRTVNGRPTSPYASAIISCVLSTLHIAGFHSYNT